MTYYKILHNNTHAFLSPYSPGTTDYYKYLDQKRKIGHIQIIMDTSLMLNILKSYKSRGYIMNDIQYEDNPFVNINDLPKSIDILITLKTFLLQNCVKIAKLCFSDLNYQNDITIHSNGIVQLKGHDIEENKIILENILNQILGVHAHAF